MNGLVQLSLKASSICSVPFNIYDSFTFIVNDQSFSSTKIVADLLSSKICNIHSTDPTFNEFTITTQNNGDFSQVLDLLNFKKKKKFQNQNYLLLLKFVKNLEVNISIYQTKNLKQSMMKIFLKEYSNMKKVQVYLVNI